MTPCLSLSLLQRTLQVGPLLFILGASLAFAGCADPPPPPELSSWTNPVTGAVVQLPEGWRHSPSISREGPTTIGYFTPKFARLFGQFGQVTLHYENLRAAPHPVTLKEFVANFLDYLQDSAEQVSEPLFEPQQGLQVARVSVQTTHRQKPILLRAYFWTANNLDFWYAIVESLTEDQELTEKALPLVASLQRSTIMTAQPGP